MSLHTVGKQPPYRLFVAETTCLQVDQLHRAFECTPIVRLAQPLAMLDTFAVLCNDQTKRMQTHEQV
jgi:hypothetical protein